MRTLLYEVILRNPVTKEVYPEEFGGQQSVARLKPGSEFCIEVSFDFVSIPSKNDIAAQTVEIEVTVNGNDIGWVFDINNMIPTCTIPGFSSPTGTIIPFRLEENLSTLIPDDDGDNEWLDELKTVEVHATVIYSYSDGGSADEDPEPSDFFEFPVSALYYHTIGTMESLKSSYTKQKRSSAEALNVALSAAITQAEYNDFYADKYDPNDDGDDGESNSDREDDDSEVEVVRFQSKAKQDHSTLGSDDDDDWWGTSAKPKATSAIQKQTQQHQQSLQKLQNTAKSTQSNVGNKDSSDSNSRQEAQGRKRQGRKLGLRHLPTSRQTTKR